MLNTFTTGLLWGASYYLIEGVPTHYYYIYYGISIGLTSAALLSLGILPRIFYAFATPLMSASLLWISTQQDTTHNIIAFITAMGLAYYFIFVTRYAKSFKQAIIDKEIAQEHFIALEKIQKVNTILKERTELALQGSGTSVLDWDYVKDTSYISPSWKEMLGYSDDELQNTYYTWKRKVHPDDLVNVIKALKHAYKSKDRTFVTRHRLQHKNGHYIWILGQALLFYNENNKLTRMIGTHINITKEKIIQEALFQEKEKLAHLAHHDTLTGLPNRLLFTDRLEQTLLKAKRNTSQFALFFIDLDNFKEINDSFGHETGDKVLQSVTKLLKSTIREDDSIARLGGDEFTVIVDNLKNVKNASSLAQKIVNTLSQALLIDKHKFYISSSIGISLYPDDGTTSVNLLKYADSAMYRAKQEGKNNYQFYKQEMTQLAMERVLMEKNLREAITNNEFVVYYQPQMDARHDTLIGMEALVRWIHPQLGMISPDKFIPLAESTGLIVQLDRFVMTTAITQHAKWYKDGYNPGTLAMNLAIKQLQQEDFIQTLQSIIKTTNCQPKHLELEITEGQIMTNPEEAIKTLKEISELEITLAIDDFGTGYSSLSYLKKLPVNKLKIDQSFIKDLPMDEEDASITTAVIALANSLKLSVIAEGVETTAQKEFLIENGCHQVQGYLYSKALPADEFEKFLK